MAEIKQFKSRADQAKEFGQNLINCIAEEDLTKMAFVGLNSKGDLVITSYHNCSLADKQYLQSHWQIDIIDPVVTANIDKYLEVVECDDRD